MINRNFTLLWLGKIISQLGDKFYAIALAWWILQQTNSPALMGFFLLVSVLPGILVGFFAGAWTDRWRRRTMLVITDLIRGCLVLAVTLLSMYGRLEIWQIFVVGFWISVATAFFDPAIQAIIPEIVPPDQLTKANGLSQIVSGICMVAGPLLGALAVSALGLTWVFLANGLSYFGAAFLAYFIEVNQADRNLNDRKQIWQEIAEGLGFIKKRRNIVFVLIVIAIAHLFVGSLTVALPFLAKGLTGNGVKNLGYLEMMIGFGLVAGSAVIGLKQKTTVKEQSLLAFILAVGFSFITISILQYFKVRTIYIYMVVMMVIGVCIALASVLWQSLLQNFTPAHMTGRVFSVSTLIGNTTLPTAYAISGILLNISSIWILTVAGGGCLVIFWFYLRYLLAPQYSSP